jgi:hypothetical protein
MYTWVTAGFVLAFFISTLPKNKLLTSVECGSFPRKHITSSLPANSGRFIDSDTYFNIIFEYELNQLFRISLVI